MTTPCSLEGSLPARLDTIDRVAMVASQSMQKIKLLQQMAVPLAILAPLLKVATSWRHLRWVQPTLHSAQFRIKDWWALVNSLMVEEASSLALPRAAVASERRYSLSLAMLSSMTQSSTRIVSTSWRLLLALASIQRARMCSLLETLRYSPIARSWRISECLQLISLR